MNWQSTPEVEATMTVWCEVTHQELTPRDRRALEAVFWAFHRAEYTSDDLRCVLLHVQHENRKRSPGYETKFKALRMVGDLEWFASTLIEARAVHRNRIVPSAREKVLASWRGTRPETATANTAVPVKAVMKDALAKLAKEL